MFLIGDTHFIVAATGLLDDGHATAVDVVDVIAGAAFVGGVQISIGGEGIVERRTDDLFNTGQRVALRITTGARQPGARTNVDIDPGGRSRVIDRVETRATVNFVSPGTPDNHIIATQAIDLIIPTRTVQRIRAVCPVYYSHYIFLALFVNRYRPAWRSHVIAAQFSGTANVLISTGNTQSLSPPKRNVSGMK